MLEIALALALSAPPINGSIEYSEQFKKAAKSAWALSRDGMIDYFEAGFVVNKDGSVGKVEGNKDIEHPHIGFYTSEGTLGVFHTHPNNCWGLPSQGDIRIAKLEHITVWVQSRYGLYVVDWNGKVERVFKGTGWLDK